MIRSTSLVHHTRNGEKAMADTKNTKDGSFRVVSSGDPTNSNRCSTEPISVNSCGCDYFDRHKKRVTILRPFGRLDYQLIYIKTGQADFFFDDTPTLLKAGSLILYKPGEKQHYSYYASCPSEAYWIHFSGVSVETLLKQNDLWEGHTRQLGEEPAFCAIIMKLAKELQLRPHNYLLMSVAYFQELLCVITRNLLQQRSPLLQQYQPFIPIIEQMHNDYQHSRSVEEYARMCDMSTYYFIHKFKEYTGFSPHAYLIKIRMERAKNLLLTSDMSISEISFSVGYDNPLYFSRIFKKYTGSSPSSFTAAVHGDVDGSRPQ